MIESNDSLKEYYVKLNGLYKNALNLLTAINQSLSTNSSEITVTIADTDDVETTVRIPSFLYLENKLEQLDNNFSNLFNMPESGEAWFNKSSNMYKLEMVRSNTAPITPEFSTTDIYASLKDNTFLKDLVSPRTFLKININNLPNNISKMFMKKIVIFNSDTFTNLQNLNLETYDDYVSALYNFTKGVDYEEYESELTLPLRKDTYKSAFQIIDIPEVEDGLNPWTDVTGGNHKHLSYKLELNTLEYYDSEDTSISFSIKAGDYLCLGNELVIYKVKSVDNTNNTVIIEEMVGHNALQKYSENNAMVLQIYNDNYDKYNYVEVPLEENRYICIFLGTIQNNIRSQYSNAYLVDLTSINMKDENGNFIKDSYGNTFNYINYYNEYCKNIGDLILGLTQSAYPQLSNYSGDILNSLQNGDATQSAVTSTLNTDNIKVVPINKHLTDDTSSEEIKNLHTQKNDINSRLSAIQDNIDQTYSTLINTDFSQNTTITQGALQTQLQQYYTERINLQKQLNAIIDNINSKSSDLKAINSEIKYRIRGVTESSTIDSYIQSIADNKCNVIGCEVQYKYKSTSKDTNTLTNINNTLFTDWNKLNNIDRDRHLEFDDTINSYRLVFTDYSSTDNIIKWNQIDIPIQNGEDVVIRVRYKLNIGQPFVNIYTPWSDEITIVFPSEYNEDVEVKTIIDENNDDTVNSAFDMKLINGGYDEHITNKLVTNDQIFFHMPENIYSGFNTPENNLISLKDKLYSIVNDIDKYKLFFESESNSKFSVSLDYDNTSVEIAQNNINKINIYNTDHITGKYIKKNMNIVIKNTGNYPVNLYSIFPGETSTPLLLANIDSYNTRLVDYERVPILVNDVMHPQTLGQWVYFRQTNPFTKSDIYFNTENQKNNDINSAILYSKDKNSCDYIANIPQDYLGVDNAQVMLGYRQRVESQNNANIIAVINQFTDIFTGISEYLDNDTLKAKLQEKIAAISVLNILDSSVYDNIPIEFYIYRNSIYNSDPQNDYQNKFLMKYSDIQGENDNGKRIFLDEDTSIVNFLSNYILNRQNKDNRGFAQVSDFSGAFFYPNLVSGNQIITGGSEQSSKTIPVGESISIPIIFEYFLDGDKYTKITKSLYFDLRNSLISNPIHYMIQVTGNYDMTATGDVYSSINNIELADEVTM